MSTELQTRPRQRTAVADIPNLDAAPVYTSLGEVDGAPMIRLPSGHEALHLVTYPDVLSILTDSSFARAVCNTDDGPSFLPTTTPDEFLLNLDGQAHGRSRRLINRSFGQQLLKRAAPLIETRITDALDHIEDGRSPPDLFTGLLEQIPFSVVASLLGIEESDRQRIRALSRHVQIANPDDVPELLRRFFELYGYIGDLAKRARTGARTEFLEDFFSEGALIDPPLEDQEAAALLLAISIGGDQNILTVMTKIVYVLLAAPELYDELVENPDHIPSAIEELIRLIPLGTLSIFPRVATQPFETSVGRFPEGTVVYADAFRANRDPDVFTDATSIDFGRQEARHLQFGYGMHNCMGAGLARLEINAVVRHLVTRFPRLRLSRRAADLPWTHGTVLRRPETLPIKWN